jgi:hypothetical protein
MARPLQIAEVLAALAGKLRDDLPLGIAAGGEVGHWEIVVACVWVEHTPARHQGRQPRGN